MADLSTEQHTGVSDGILDAPFRVGHYVVDPSSHELIADGRSVKLEPLLTRLLGLLAEQHGQVVKRERLIDQIWPDSDVGDESLTQAVSKLRRALGDTATRPRYIQTVPKSGYRLVASVESNVDVTLAGLRLNNGSTLAGRSGLPIKRIQALIAAVAVLLMVITVAFVVVRAQSDVRGIPDAQPIPFTTLHGRELDPAISTDGKRVAYVWDGGNGSPTSLHVRPIDSDTPTRLGADGDYRVPAWSPDGTRIAVIHSTGPDATTHSIRVLSTDDGTVLHDWPIATGRIAAIGWSVDGTAILYSDREGPNGRDRIMLRELQTATTRALTSPDARLIGDYSPRLSPAGRELAFVRVSLEGVADVYIQSIETGSARRVTHAQREILGLEWSANGRSVLVATLADGGFRLRRIHTAAGRPDDNAETLFISSEPLYSFAVNASIGELIYVASDVEVNIRRHNSGKASGEQVAPSTAWNSNPAASPDGKRLAFASTREIAPEIWVTDSSGDHARRLTDYTGPYVLNPSWSSDSRQLVYEVRNDGQADLYSLDAESASTKRLTDTPYDEILASYAGDGSSVVFTSNADSAWNAWSLDLSTGERTQLSSGGAFGARMSPQGDAILYTKVGVDGLWRMELPDGTESLLYPNLRADDWGLWAVDDEAVYIAHRLGDNRYELIRMDGSAPKSEFEFSARVPENQRALSVAPGGRAVYVSNVERIESNLKRISWSDPL